MRSLFLIVFVLTGLSITATHVVGSELTYKYVGGSNYRFQVKYWVDCSSTIQINQVFVNGCAPSCNVTFLSMTLPVLNPGGTPVFPACAWPNSMCSNGPDPGIREFVFADTFSLQACSDWTFYTEICCRSGSITTINNPLSMGMNVRATLNNSPSPVNSSPVISALPVAYACCNQALSFTQTASDADGDSLVYSFYTPWDDGMSCWTASGTVTYTNPYTFSQFLTTQTPISLNTANGDIFLHPTLCGQISVFGLKISEYQNSVLVGSMSRDIMITVMPSLVGTGDVSSDENLIHFDSDRSVLYIQPGADILLVDIQGKELLQGYSSDGLIYLSNLAPGIYCARSGNRTVKFLKN
ncbi:MAG: hypothetical protein IT233_10085 [Bacteroidia bacterium]|nr:hypothetical protein [Bacteroidia bacterium]